MPAHSSQPRDRPGLPPEDGDAAARAAIHERLVRRPLRRFQALTLVTGAVSAAATAGVLALQSVPGYARSVLESRAWGAAEVSEADVAAFLTPPGALPAAVAGVLAVTALLWLGTARRVRTTRWVGTALVGLGLLSAAFWMVDGGRMVAAGGGGPVVLALVVAMLVLSAVWLLLAHLRSTRDAFDG